MPVRPGCLGVVQAMEGKGSLTRCTLRKSAASPPAHMTPVRVGAVQLSGPASVNLQHCYVEVGGRHDKTSMLHGNLCHTGPVPRVQARVCHSPAETHMHHALSWACSSNGRAIVQHHTSHAGKTVCGRLW
jgi:hypothetical protein